MAKCIGCEKPCLLKQETQFTKVLQKRNLFQKAICFKSNYLCFCCYCYGFLFANICKTVAGQLVSSLVDIISDPSWLLASIGLCFQASCQTVK